MAHRDPPPPAPAPRTHEPLSLNLNFRIRFRVVASRHFLARTWGGSGSLTGTGVELGLITVLRSYVLYSRTVAVSCLACLLNREHEDMEGSLRCSKRLRSVHTYSVQYRGYYVRRARISMARYCSEDGFWFVLTVLLYGVRGTKDGSTE